MDEEKRMEERRKLKKAMKAMKNTEGACGTNSARIIGVRM
jgi:hypothetical protein